MLTGGSAATAKTLNASKISTVHDAKRNFALGEIMLILLLRYFPALEIFIIGSCY